ncbi:MAG: PAS domain S-box protein, partial [Burkholderiales bacterium]
MNDPKPLHRLELESPRYTQLEYEALLANLSLGIAFTRDRRFFLCNPKFAEMFGYGPDELIGMPGETVYPSRESYLALGQIATPVLGAGRQLDLEWEVRRKDGSTFLCRMIAKAIDPADTQSGTVWIVEDITERRRHADEISRLLAEQQALLDNVVVGIAISRERRLVRCNRRFEEMFGFAAGAAIGISWRQVYFTEEEFDKRARVYAELDQGRTHAREQWLRRQDGSGFWCRVSGRAVAAGEPARGYVWLMEDITERRRADEALERLVREQDAVLQNAVTGIIFVKDRRIVRCNRRFEELFGYGAGELVNHSTRFMFASDE